ncbi:MAG: bacterial transcriptional activator domain-containing protein, partial [Eggerthellaceae bacterium]|nr:bacterial transcriptional activator domain-containing protein [Eggerthellaceae bacterium]
KATDQYALAYAGAAATMGIERYCECWKELAGAKVSDDVLCTLSTWLFELAQMDIEHGEDASRVSAICAPAQRFVRGLLSDPRHASDAFAKRAGIALERAHMNGLDLEGGSLDSQVLYDLRKYEMDCLTQQREYQAQREDSQKRMQVRVETHPDSYLSLRENRPMKLVDKSVPPLTVNLFGRLEVFLGDELIESNYLKHRKVRILLCLRVINEGRDVSRESSCRYVWPNSDSMLARKNFYSLWSQLKKTLSLPDGTCPYLVRHQLGCAINERYVNSDISRFNEICRELLFGEVDVDNFAEYYREIDCHYSDDLVPCEALNPLIVQSRNEYRARLVDALVAGTDCIVEAGNPQWGIWFSRTAIAHDPTREDAYVSLMKAQLAAGQRTAALMTFLECRRALRDELGVDPSQETISLYESMLDVAV